MKINMISVIFSPKVQIGYLLSKCEEDEEKLSLKPSNVCLWEND